MTFKEKIIKLRKQKGLTQDEFASAVGVSRQAVYKWESGQSYPEAQKLLEIKKLFDISIDDLLDDNFEVVIPEKKKRKRLPKEVKAEVEAEVASLDLPSKEEAPTVPSVEEPVAEKAAEVPVEEVSLEAAALTETAPEAKEDAPAIVEEVPSSEDESSEDDSDSDEPKKKKGFFGRIFGRK